MKFKDTQIGDRLTVWQSSQRHYILKINEEAAVDLATGAMIHIHKNKDVEPIPTLTSNIQIGVYRGEVIACRQMDAQHYAITSLCVTGETIVKRDEVSVMQKNPINLTQVYIIMNVMKKRLHELEAMSQTVEVLIAEATGETKPGPEYIMSTSNMATPIELPGE